MENKINIAEILKDKPKGTKLYSSACGKCKLEEVDDKSFKISFYNSKFGFMNGGEGYLDKNGKLYDDGECVVFPSKEMRDWSKFAWKKGDVLIMDGYRVVFDKWLNDDYTRFNAVHLITPIGGYIDKPLQNRYSPISNFITRNWRKMTDAETKIYMDSLERECGGKLNRETLVVEKLHPEFKDGDIVVAEGENKGKKIFIFRYKIRDSNTDEHGYKSYINVNSDGSLFNNMTFYLRKDFVYRLATDSEKQQLFDALAKDGKAWDAEKKQIVDLKPKVDELKPFDKVLSRRCSEDYWVLNFYSHKTDYYHVCIDGSSNLDCIPYNEETAHLLGTTDDWEEVE